MELSFLYFKGLPFKSSIKLCISVPDVCFYLSKLQTQMKCRLMRHFIWVFTVCHSTCLLVSRKKQAYNIGIAHVFSCINICRVSRMLFEYEAERPSVHHHPRDPASVNAMKQTCVIVILAYFTLFQPNLH